MRVIASVLILMLCSSSLHATDDVVQLGLGGKYTGAIGTGEIDRLVFDAVEGTQLTAAVTGKHGFRPLLQLVALESGQIQDVSQYFTGLGKKATKLKKFPILATGTYELQVSGFASSVGIYKATLKGRTPKSARTYVATATVPAGEDYVMPFDAVGGSTVNFVVKYSVAPDASPVPPSIDEPDGGSLQLDEVATVKAKSISAKKVLLPQTGTHALRLTGPESDEPVSVKIKLRVKLPKSKLKLADPELPELSSGSISGDLAVEPLYADPEVEPNDNPSLVNLIGSMGPGSVKRVTGTTSALFDFFSGFFFYDLDGFRVTFSGDQYVVMALLHAPFANADLYFFDPISGEQVYYPGVSPSGPELAVLYIPPGGRTLDIVVQGVAGSTGYILTMASGGAGAVSSLPAHVAVREPLAPGALPPSSSPVARRLLQLDEEFVEGEFLVRLKDADRAPGDWADSRGLSVRHASPSGVFVAADPTIASLTDPDARRLATSRARNRAVLDPAVEYAELNMIHRAFGQPTDPLAQNQWHYGHINLPQAWDVTTGSNSVLVAVIDTGVTAHPDLTARDSGFGYDMISLPGMSLDGDGIDPDPTDPGDKQAQFGSSTWHGTHVAGTVGASTNNGKGVAGVDWGCQLMHVRVLGYGGGTSYDIFEGLRYAAGLPNASGTVPPKRADVINMSLGGSGFSTTGANAALAARNAGVTIVAAAGNASSSTPQYPASYDGVISVSAVNQNDQLAGYSSYGSMIDVSAPGGESFVDGGVLSTLIEQSFGGAGSPGYASYEGTSMASPHVAGVCSLMLAAAPGLSPDEIEQALESTAVDLGSPGWDQLFGAGRIDAFSAVSAVASPVNGPALSLSTTSLAFGSDETSLPVVAGNAGTEPVNFSVAVHELTGAGWLSATPTSGAAPTSIQVSVNRSAVPFGTYHGEIVVSSNGGTKSVQVSMDKSTGGSTILPLGPVYVLAVNPIKNKTVGSTAVSSFGGSFHLDDLPPGNWLLAAGPDLDGDNVVCGIGEPCGIYPVVSNPTLVGLLGEDLSGFDFSVGETFQFSLSQAPQLQLPTSGFSLSK